MIETLSVRDLAVVEKSDVSFSAGLNTITGETGAGKSVLLGAIGLLTGSRSDRSQVRANATQAQVRATFKLPEPVLALVSPLLEEAGIDPCEDGILLLHRTITANGGGRCTVNGCPATVQTLRRIGVHLVDFHGPHDNQSLLDPAFQLMALDSFGNCKPIREEYAAKWNAVRELEARRKELLGDNTESIARELDLLRYQVREIEDAHLDPETDGEALLAEYRSAANAARILELGSISTQALAEGEMNAVDLLAAAVRSLEEMRDLDCPKAAEWLDQLRSSTNAINDLAREISSSLSKLDCSPEHLQELESRISLVESLRHKYGRTIPDVLEFLKKAQTRLESLESRDQTLADLNREIAERTDLATAIAKKLSAARRTAADRLASAVKSQLADLGLARAGFQIEITPVAELRPTGADEVSYGFAPNPGEPMRPLRLIASSGEISRVMLALKTVLAAHDLIPVLVFDEIDANVGGEIARVVGEKLATLGKSRQVLCITHLPQVAACGHRHFAVQKHVAGERTFTQITCLSPEERIEEITRMLGGAALTSVTREHARELLSRSALPPSPSI